VIVVVDEAVAQAEEFIEALFGGAVIEMRAKMPFSKQGRFVTFSLKRLSQGDFLKVHIPSLAAFGIALNPCVHAAALRMSSGQQKRAGGTADGMGIGLGEANAAAGK
jgi:hypothetical protein